MVEYANLGERIQNALDAREMTQADLARMSGLSTSLIAQIVSGRTENPRFDTVITIANTLEVPLDYLALKNVREIPKKANGLSREERELLDIMRTITPEGQKQLMIYARGIASTYSKSNQVKSA